MGVGFWVLVFISNFFSLHVDLWVVSFWVSNFFSLRFLGQKIFLPCVFGSQISFLRFLGQRIFLPLVFGS